MPADPLKVITIEEFRALIAASEAQCQLCSYKGHSIVAHIRSEHKLSPDQYRNKFPTGRIFSQVVGEVLKRIDRKQQSSADFEEHVQYFSIKGDPTKVFKDFKAALVKYPAAMAEFIPSRVPNFEFEEQDKRIAWAFAKRKNVYIEGPTGSGKTECVQQVALEMGLPIRRVNMNGDVTVKNFIGSKEAGPQGTYFKEGILPWCMENGVPLLVDEIDFTPPHIASILHPVLEYSRKTYIPDAGKEYKAKDGFTIIATANTGGKGDETGVYTGTEILNSAFLDRFTVKMKKDYLSPAREEAMLLARFPTETSSHIQKMVQLAGDIRQSFLSGKLAFTISTRKLIDYFEMKRDFDHDTALDMAVMSWMSADDVTLVSSIVDRIQLGGVKKKK